MSQQITVRLNIKIKFQETHKKVLPGKVNKKSYEIPRFNVIPATHITLCINTEMPQTSLAPAWYVAVCNYII